MGDGDLAGALEPPDWLPAGRRGPAARRFWRALAADVEALEDRYPRQLARLPADWWAHPILSERLGALVAWRRGLDTGIMGHDPRAELEFHQALERIHTALDARAKAIISDDDGPTHHPGEPRSDDARAERRTLLENALTDLPDEESNGEAMDVFADPHAGRPRAMERREVVRLGVRPGDEFGQLVGEREGPTSAD